MCFLVKVKFTLCMHLDQGYEITYLSQSYRCFLVKRSGLRNVPRSRL